MFITSGYWVDEKLNCNVKQIKETNFNIKFENFELKKEFGKTYLKSFMNNLIQSERIEQGMGIGHSNSFYYNENQQLERVAAFNENGQIKTTTFFEYDCQGKIISKKKFSENERECEGCVLYSYPNENNVLYIDFGYDGTVFDLINTEFITQGSTVNRRVIHRRFDKDFESGRVQELFTRKVLVNHVGDKIEVEFDDGSMMSYDSKTGNKLAYYKGNELETQYVYEFDEFGNWTKKEEKDKGAFPKSIIERQILYW